MDFAEFMGEKHRPVLDDSLGDMISLRQRWSETHETETALCAECKLHGEEHWIEVCARCGWPPALNGRCYCDDHETWPRYA